MTELKFVPDNGPGPDDDFPPPGPSQVTFAIIAGTSHFSAGDIERFEFDYIDYDGGDAAGLAYQGSDVLEDAIRECMWQDNTIRFERGWYVIDGLRAHYTQDYYGECDCSYECDGIRHLGWLERLLRGLPLFL